MLIYQSQELPFIYRTLLNLVYNLLIESLIQQQDTCIRQEMSDNEEMNKSKSGDHSIEVGTNERFLSRNHARYDDGDENEGERQNQHDQNIDESMDKHLAAMEDNHEGEMHDASEQVSNGRGNRGNRGNRKVEEAPEQVEKEEEEHESEKSQEQEKPQQRKGRGNRMPNNLSDDEKPPSPSSPNNRRLRSNPNQNQPSQQQKEQHSEHNEQKQQQQQEEKQEQKPKPEQDSEDWDASVDNKADENEQEPKGRNGRSSRSEAQTKKKQQTNVLDESNWDDETNNQQKKQQQKPSRRGNKQSDEDEKELQPDKDKSEQPSKQSNQNAGRGRGNRRDRPNRYQNENENDNNQTFGGPRQGNRNYNNNENGNGYQNRAQNNRGQNNWGQNRANNYGREREGGNNWRGGRSDFRGGYRGNQDRQGYGENQERNGRNFERRNYNNDRQDNRLQEGKNQGNQTSNVSSKVQQVPIYDAVPIIEPKGAESWPEVSFYVRKCKVSVTLRTINENKADAIVFPFEDMKFKLYPSTLICEDSKFNFRKKIQQKFDSNYWQDHNIYPKKGEKIGNFNDVLFWKVEEKQDEEIKKFILQLFQFLIAEKQSKSVVFPICKQLGKFDMILSAVINCLHSLNKKSQGFLQRFEFTTKDPEYFKQSGSVFWNMIMQHIDSNQIYIL